MTYKMKGFSYPGKSPVKYNGGDPIESGYTEQGDSFLEAVDEDLEAGEFKDEAISGGGDDQVLKASINAAAKIGTALINKGGKKKKEKKNLTDAFATMNLGTNRDA